MTLLFFRGKGIVPVVVRLLTWRWWEGQRWREAPAHVALFWQESEGGWIEIEAIVTGVVERRIASLPSDGVVARFDFADGAKALAFARSQVGRRYGFEAALLTGAAANPLWRRAVARIWKSHHATLPADCSVLAEQCLRKEGVVSPWADTPTSPNGLMLWLSKKVQTP